MKNPFSQKNKITKDDISSLQFRIGGFFYGFDVLEFTLKLKKYDFEDLEGELKCICGILQSIARITFNSGTIFGANEFIRTGQTTGISLYCRSYGKYA